jgi:glycosyltransferase involved in cell wall biosynthesis
MLRPTVSFAVFAYNEEGRIAAALDAIAACADEADLVVHVLINGCTDGTERVVRAHPAPGLALRPVVIARGDKANAWNHYVHEVAPEDAAIHVFTDGDMLLGRGSVAGFLRCFAAEPDAWGCAGLPSGGRSRDAFRDKLVREREMAGNLYALRGSCVMAFRRRGIRLPFGIFGEDGLVTTLVKWSLDTRGPRDDRRVVACADATFGYEPLSPYRLRDLRIYRKRKMRYAVRQQQANMLYPLLFEQGIEAMPPHVIDLYRARADAMELRWNGLDTWFDWVACRRIRRDLAAADESVREAERAHLYS